MREQKLQTGRGGRLKGRLWLGDRESRGILVIVHGLGDHSGRYASLAGDLIAQGWAVFAFDLQGHGESPGRRGGADSFDGLLEDIAIAIGDAERQFDRLPIVLLGCSMGGNLAINYALRTQGLDADSESTRERSGHLKELDGLVLAAPMLLPPAPPQRPHIFAAWLTGHLLPWLRVHRPVDVERLTSDARQAEVIRKDSQLHGSITIYLATQLLSQGRWALDHARDLSLPTLVMYGDQDELIDRAACEHLPMRAGSGTSIVCWPGKRHAIFHDQTNGEISNHLVEWLQQFLD